MALFKWEAQSPQSVRSSACFRRIRCRSHCPVPHVTFTPVLALCRRHGFGRHFSQLMGGMLEALLPRPRRYCNTNLQPETSDSFITGLMITSRDQELSYPWSSSFKRMLGALLPNNSAPRQPGQPRGWPMASFTCRGGGGGGPTARVGPDFVLS